MSKNYSAGQSTIWILCLQVPPLKKKILDPLLAEAEGNVLTIEKIVEVKETNVGVGEEGVEVEIFSIGRLRSRRRLKRLMRKLWRS